MSVLIRNRFSKGFSWMAVGSFAEQGTNAIVFLLLARLLGPEQFGLWAMAAALLVLGETAVRETLSDYLIAAPQDTWGLRSTVFWCLMALSGAVSLGLTAIAEPLAWFYHAPEVARLLLAISPIPLLLGGSAVQAALLRRELHFRALSIRAVAGMIAGGIVGVAMALTGFGVWALVAQRLVMTAVNAAIAWLAIDWRPRLRFDRAAVGPVLAFGRGVLGVRLADLAAVQLPSIAIGALQGPLVLGYFSIAWRLTELSSFLITTPLRLAAQSAFAAMHREEGDAAGLLTELAGITALLALPAFAGLAVLSSPFIALLAGNGWEPAAPVLSVLAIYGGYLCIAKLHQSFVLALGRPEPLALAQWAEVTLGLLMVVLVGARGPAFSAAALVVAVLVLAPLRLSIVGRAAGLSIRALVRPVVQPLLAALAMAAVVWLAERRMTGDPAIVRLVLGGILGVVVHGLWSWVFMRGRVAQLTRSFVPGFRRASRPVAA